MRFLGTAKTSLFWISSTELVKSLMSSGSSENVIMKNSSCGLAVLKNSITASLARSILLLMLPLESKMTPRETGASSLEKLRISCDRISFEQLEILFFQSGHQAVHRIGDGHRHQHQVYIHFQRTHMGAQAMSLGEISSAFGAASSGFSTSRG